MLHDLFFGDALFTAPGLAGPPLSVAVALARWAIWAGPALLVALWVLGGVADKRAAVGACLAAFLALAIAAAISAAYFHPRPFTAGLAPNVLAHAPDSSFPSDHAALLFALAFSFALAPPSLWRRAWIAVLALASAVGGARVYLGAHFPLDVLGGAVDGLFCAVALASAPGRALRDAATALGQKAYQMPLDWLGPKKAR